MVLATAQTLGGFYGFSQVKDLYAQHTEVTGQVFEEAALNKIFYYTQGQPWLVNALGRELCFDEHKVPARNSIRAIDVINAVEVLILRRDVHLDQLADKITEPRVAHIIQSILIGEKEQADKANINEHQQYLLDLGLIRVGTYGLEIANPIYREVIPRELTLYQ